MWLSQRTLGLEQKKPDPSTTLGIQMPEHTFRCNRVQLNHIFQLLKGDPKGIQSPTQHKLLLEKVLDDLLNKTLL